MINLVISFRKRTNKYLGGLWIFLGKNARKILSKRTFINYTSKKIGAYGPFKLTPEFLFSNLERIVSGRIVAPQVQREFHSRAHRHRQHVLRERY